MKTHAGFLLVFATLAAAALLSGCATSKVVRKPALYLWRSPVVAMIPAANSSQEVSAPIVIDKLWGDKFQEKGFTIVDSDRVVTYASSRGVSLDDVRNADYVEIGRDLSADFLLYNEILDWGSSFHLTQSVLAVACRSKLVEARTGAVIWEFDWVYIDQSGAGGNIIADAIVAAAHSLTNSATDGVAKAAGRGVNLVSNSLPYEGSPEDELGKIRTKSSQ
jgi:hypothetical protein